MRHSLSRTAVALGVSLVAAISGCDSTHIGNPPADPGDPVVATATLGFADLDESPAQELTLPDQSYGVDAAWVVLSEVQLTPEGDCDNAASVDIEGPVVVDLISGDSYPPMPTFERGTGVFCQFRFKLHHKPDHVLPSDVPVDMEGLSVRLEGHRSDGVPFVFLEDKPHNLKLNSRDQRLALEPGEQSLILGFAVSEWLDVDALNAEPDTATIRIDGNNAREVYRSFGANVGESTALYRDNNGDGRLNAGENNAPIAVGQPETPGSNGGGPPDDVDVP